MGRKEAGLSGFLGGLGSHEMLELVILGSIRDACASPFRRRATCCWATGPMARLLSGDSSQELPFLT